MSATTVIAPRIHQVNRALKSTILIALLTAATILSLVIGGIGLQKTSNENKARLNDVQANAIHQQAIFCSYFTGVSGLTPSAIVPSTPAGQQIKSELQGVVAGANVAKAGLACPAGMNNPGPLPVLPPPEVVK